MHLVLPRDFCSPLKHDLCPALQTATPSTHTHTDNSGLEHVLNTNYYNNTWIGRVNSIDTTDSALWQIYGVKPKTRDMCCGNTSKLHDLHYTQRTPCPYTSLHDCTAQICAAKIHLSYMICITHNVLPALTHPYTTVLHRYVLRKYI